MGAYQEQDPIYEMYSLGEQAVTVRFKGEIGDRTRRLVDAFVHQLEKEDPNVIVEWIRAYTTVTVFYDPWLVYKIGVPTMGSEGRSPYRYVADLLERLLDGIQLKEAEEPLERCAVEVPVGFGDEWGPDLTEVAERAGLSADEFVRRYCEAEYTVAMIGFLPGFPYLSGLPAGLAAPRRREPRALVPAGSVGIAGHQTGIYPLASPGGWQLIGRTPLALFGPDREPKTLLQAGDRVRFRPLDEAGYAELERQLAEEAKAK